MTEDSQNFEQLQRLLALKRHEVPPPGYFHHFSREIILRIKGGELGDNEARWWAFDGSWLKWLWMACERRPVLAGGASVALCGFFAAATFISASGDVPAVGVGVSRAVPSNQYVSAQIPIAPSATPEATVVDSVLNSDFPGFVRTSSGAQPAFLATPANFQWQESVSVGFRP
jgi:hypothetical protein